MTLPRPNKNVLSEAALSRLRRQILQSKRPRGALLAEAAVARELQVSRVPVREALFTLEREGLVEFSDTGRAYVRTLRPEDFEELFVMRLALEPLAARLAASRKVRDTRRMEANVLATGRARSLAEVTALDLEFHALLMEFSGNRRLLQSWRSLRYELELWLGDLHRDHQRQTRQTRDLTVRGHEALLHALCEDAPAVLERKVREHILGWREWLPMPAPQ